MRGNGFGRAASLSHALDRRTGASPNLPYFCIYGSSGWASVMVLPWKTNKTKDPGCGYGIKRVSHAFDGMTCMYVYEKGDDVAATHSGAGPRNSTIIISVCS